MSVSWLAVGGKTYIVEAATNLAVPNTFTDASPPIEIIGTGDSIATFLDPGAATNSSARFYRVRLQ
jgi:hypothetical protein